MSDAEYYNYGHGGGAYAGGDACGYSAPEPVQPGCWNEVMQQPAYTVQTQPQMHTQQTHTQQSYVMQQPQPVYEAPQQSYVVEPQQQTYQMPQQQSYVVQQPQQRQSYVVQPAQPQSYVMPQTIQNYEQSYTQSQPTYTTGHYGTHAGHGYQQPLRGYYGTPTVEAPNRFYVQGYGGVNLQGESEVEGVTSGFTTGNIGDGSTIVVADGTEYSWETDFDNGYAYGVEAGYRLHKGWRVGLEGTRTTADVDGHEEIILGGNDIGALDGATLVGTGTTPLGATVNDFLADGQGDITQTGVFLNGYYDFNEGGRFRPYVGAGIGIVDVDVNYAPSGSPIIDESGTVLGYQGRVGASYNVKGPLDVFTEYTYRATGDVDSENLIFAGDQELKTKQSLVTVGARYNF